MTDDDLARLEDNAAVQRALQWWQSQPEPRDAMALLTHLKHQLGVLAHRALRELPDCLATDDLMAAFDPAAVSIDARPTALARPPEALTPAQRATWAQIAEERDEIAAGLAGLRARVTETQAAIVLDNPGGDHR